MEYGDGRQTRPVQIEARLMSGATLNFGKRDINVGADFSRDAMNSVCNPVNAPLKKAL